MYRLAQIIVSVLIIVFSLFTGIIAYRFAESRHTPAPAYEEPVIPRISAEPRTTPPRPVRPTRRVKRPTNATLCLAQNLYFEARYEPAQAIEAVAATVFNRMKNPGFPSSVCGVVYQRFQYSWTRETWRWSIRPPTSFLTLASSLLSRQEQVQQAWDVTHFHRYDIRPRWASTLTYVGQFGAHIFYRM